MSSSPPIGAAIHPVTPLQQNCTIVWCTKTMKAAVIDPGGEVDDLLAIVKAKGLTLDRIWVTHGHADHAGGVAEMAERTGVMIEGPHPADQYWIDLIEPTAARYGLHGARAFTPDRWLGDGDRLQVGEAEFEVYHCPGHTPGHVVIFQREAKFAQVGDVLFQGAIGRWDFPHGNLEDLVNAIRTKLWPLGDDVRFVPGHGPMSTFGEERRTNPYVSDRALARA
ncbi:MAG: MBL fold metallo-hydrolase [Caulobacteraceae bacterium]